MKKISVILMALALVMGMTQCKKETPTSNNNIPVLEGETYHITLTLSNGGDGGRHIVHPMNDVAPVEFQAGDVIYVAYNGRYAGTLTCSGPSNTLDPVNGDVPIYLGAFSGDITLTPSGDQKLHFFFLGNKEENAGLKFNMTGAYCTGFEINITDQTTALPVISYAPSVENFTGNGTYSVQYDWLLNKCALVKFTSENIYDQSTNPNDNNPEALYTTSKNITIKGVNNLMTIDFSGETPTFTPSMINGGEIKLNNIVKEGSEGDEVRYAIVLAGDYSSIKDDGTPGEVETEDFYGTYEIGKNIANNDYCKDAELHLVWHSGAFSIGANKVAYFSRGNLQYAARGAVDPNGTWRFAKHQYDFVGGLCEGTTDTYLGNVVKNENSDTDNTMSDNTQVLNISNYSGWIDLFGWGTGNIPTEYRSDNLFYTGTSLPSYNNHDGFHEWGKNNIVNSGTPGNTSWWETLSKNESVYLFDERTDAQSKVGFGQIVVNENLTVNGLVILPDVWTISSYPTSNGLWQAAGATSHDYTNNKFNSVADWMEMEAAGAVFLPAAGYRDTDGWPLDPKIEFDGGSGDHGENQDRGTYYLSEIQGTSAAWSLGFGTASGDDLVIGGFLQVLGNDHVNPKMGCAPDNGRSVRLVHKVSTGSKLFNKKD